MQSIKGLSTNKVLIKTSKVLDQFMKDLRECEVKIQILEQRQTGLKARQTLLSDEIKESEDVIKAVL